MTGFINALFLHPLAEIELNEAIDYYNERQLDLGKEFNKEVYSTIQTILAFPEAWFALSKNTRRCLLISFPVRNNLLNFTK